MENISDCEPTTLRVRCNDYHINLSIYVLDVIRLFQDHPKYANGLTEASIVEMLQKESFANGDLEAQVKTVLMDLTGKGFVRFMNYGYRTLGPFAKLANARTARQYNMAWERIADSQIYCNRSKAQGKNRNATYC